MKLPAVLIATLSTLPLLGCADDTKTKRKKCCENTVPLKQVDPEARSILLKQIDYGTEGLFAYGRGEVEIGIGELEQWGFLIEALEKYTGLKKTEGKRKVLNNFFQDVKEGKKTDPNGDGKQNHLDVIHIWRTQK